MQDRDRLKVEDVCSGTLVRDRGIVTQRNAGRPVQFEITDVSRQSVERPLASRQVGFQPNASEATAGFNDVACRLVIVRATPKPNLA